MNRDIYSIEADQRREQRERFLTHEQQLQAEYKLLCWRRYNTLEDLRGIDAEIERVAAEIVRLNRTDEAWSDLDIDIPLADDEDFSIPAPAQKEEVPVEWHHNPEACDYLVALKARFDAQINAPMNSRMYSIAEFIYWRCYFYPNGALIGRKQIMGEFKISELTFKRYIRALKQMGLIAVVSIPVKDIRPTKYEWINADPELVLYACPKK